jgi:lipopolysaccharide biosynthesis protein
LSGKDKPSKEREVFSLSSRMGIIDSHFVFTTIYKKYFMRISVLVHLYHIDMWEQIKNYLNNIKFDYKLYVNICGYTPNQLPSDFNWEEYLSLHQDLISHKLVTEEKSTNHFLKHGIKEKRYYKKSQIDVVNDIKKYKNDSVVIMSDNKGMDIGGFLYTYKIIDKDTDLILKIHTKKGLGDSIKPSLVSRRVGHDEAIKVGYKWFNELMCGVLRNEDQVNRIVDEFKKNNQCGMVGFRTYGNFGKNINEMIKLFPILKIPTHIEDTKFVGGTIFWVRNDILKKYLDDETIDDILENLPYGYVYEPSPNHAMERIFGSMVYNEDKELLVID